MGLFKEFKDDFSQAMNELVPGGDEPKKVKDSVDNLVVDTLGEDVDVKSELSKLGTAGNSYKKRSKRPL